MKNWVSILIIVILILIVVAIGVFAFTILKKDTPTTDTTDVAEELIQPTMTISKEVTENGVIITVEAVAGGEDEISSIELPDETSIVADTTTYEVNKNGDYTFTAFSTNGESCTETVTVSELEEVSSKNPYMPKGFKEVGGEPDSGYVIEDDFGNQYVWVPVESGKLTRDTMLNTEYEETDSGATALVNSVAQYYGFYIARFEASQFEKDGKIVAASMAGKTPWTAINSLDAISYSVASAGDFGYEDCQTALISSFAWDTVLEWVNNKYTNYSSNTNYGNYSGTVYPSGYTEQDNVNNICDLAGNVREWTTEIYKETQTKKNRDEENTISRVVRGGSATASRTPAAHTGYPESMTDPYWGFRMVLFK